MRKRKYDSELEQTSKKSKTDDPTTGARKKHVENDRTEIYVPDENLVSTPANRRDCDIKQFRKELATKQGQTMVLTQFLQVCLNPDNEVDYLLEYLKSGGNSHEILRQVTQNDKKNLTLTTPAFHLFHLIILKVQSSLPHLLSVTEEACRYFLNTFMSTVEIMISENSGPRHRKIILKILTSMVTMNPDLGMEVLNQAPLTPKHLQYIVDKTNYKEKDNVRTSFVHFMTSFLVDGHLPLIKALLEKQGLLALVIPGLIQDEAEAVLMFLNILKKNVIDNNFISKSLKLKTFSHQILHNIFKIFSWRGPPELSNAARNQSRPEIMDLLSQIVQTLFTSHRLGLYFTDTSLGTADANKNQNLYKALLTLKRPWENEFECEAILQIMHKCPDLHRAIISVIEHSFEPQYSPIWERTVDFVVKLLDKLKPEDMVPRMTKMSSMQVANFIRFITLPIPLLKFIQKSLGKDLTISLYCIKVLVKMLQTLRRYMQILEMDDSQHFTDLKNKLEYFVPKHLPAPSVAVSLIQEVITGKEAVQTKDYTLPKPNDTESLITLVELLLLYNDIHPTFFDTLEGSIDLKKLLDYSSTLSDDRISLLKFKIVSLWLTLDSLAISLKNPMFKDLFLIMLEVYMSDHDNTWIEAKDTLKKFFRKTSIFEGDEDEIHLMLYTLRNSKVHPASLIGDIVEYVLANSNDLTEYVRKQIGHFEISDENSEVNMEKLFNDLMENKCTQDSVFLENKVPSSFIVGCMQYIQINKDAKKHLKHFLSLYIANLLHCNYSPELTDVLIGDSKLEVRNYVASWVAQPVSLPEAIVSKDNVLKNISKSLIDSETITLNDIFDCIEETTKEESDYIVKETAYKINVKNIDSSELMIWAKYLIFCIIRLTNMDQLKEEQMKKVVDYFECIFAIGKKNHMVHVCRIIILSLFKNPHFLKIYRPIELSKDGTNILATQFILNIIVQHDDIVKYLDKKHKLLKSHQHKNYNEIVKAFIKINKMKNVNSDHTIHVLKVVGLSKEDDLKVFNEIFGAKHDFCFKEDKEPSLVLELLRILIEKYAKSTALEPQPGVLKKTLDLYTDLLTKKDIVVNLTNLENALILFLENKPYHAVNITGDVFKKFFEAGSIRKTTSKLASVLLKLNVKFCNIYKEQLKKPEILSRRELTLPLGNTLLNHNQFLIDNKELIKIIYEEYKTNIFKVLEKPHKAGQIYITCWAFIRKLIIECMETEDAIKLFNKIHKFETVETNHVNLFQTVFLKLCLQPEYQKKEYLTNYFSSMLHLTTIALKESKSVETITEVVTKIYNVLQICYNAEFEVEKKTDFQKLVGSGIWQNCCKVILKDSLKVKTADQVNSCGPRLLYLLKTLVKLFYPPDHPDIVSLFDMVTSHSEFLNVMLSHHSSDIKSRVIEFIHTLISLNKTVMKTQHIPVYLSAYHATRKPCDRIILSILNFYENNGQPVNEYKPYVFGDLAANHYAVRRNRTSSLWAHPSPNQVLNLFEKDIIDRTVRNFPVTQKLDYHYELPSNIDYFENNNDTKSVLTKMSEDGLFKPLHVKDNETAIKVLILKSKHETKLAELKLLDHTQASHAKEDEEIYDPVFMFSLLSHLLAPGSAASCFKLLRTGLLSVPVVALSSQCPMMRASAYHVLHRFCLLLETETKHKNDKLFLTDFINTLRQSLATAITQSEEGINNFRNPRLPAIDALYLARALMVSTAPSDPLYKSVNNFFIAKQVVDMTVVPDFLSLFHDSDVESADRRNWILDVIKDGTKTMVDVNVVFKTMCLKMIMDFNSSVLCDRKTQEKILGVICSMVAIPRAFEILVEGYGLISWLHSVVRQIGNDGKSANKVVEVLKNMLQSMTLNSFARNVNSGAKNGKALDHFELKVNKDLESEILVIAYDLLQHLDSNKDLSLYVSIYKSISKRTVKLLTKKQMLSLVNKCLLVEESEGLKLLTKALVRTDANFLKSKLLETEGMLLKELTCVVRNYLV